MDLSKFALPTVYPHKEADSKAASLKLFESLMTNVDDNSQLIRLSPSMFICVQTTDSENDLPKCFMINTTDNDHWVSNLDTNYTDTEKDDDEEDEINPKDLGIGQGSTNPDCSTTLAKASDILHTGTVDDDNLPTDDPRDDIIVKPANVPASYFTTYDHDCPDCDKASQIIEGVLSKKYGGQVVRHSPTEFTHIRGKTIDNVSTDNSKHYIKSSLFSTK